MIDLFSKEELKDELKIRKDADGDKVKETADILAYRAEVKAIKEAKAIKDAKEIK